MKGLKWSLSFNSSRPNRQTKKLWIDANLKCIEEDFDMNKMKGLGLFLDVSLSAQDPPAQRSVIDELSEDLVGIFQTLIFWTKLCQRKIKQVTTTNHEEVALISEVMVKALSVVEIISTVKGTKVSLRDLIVTNNPCIRSVLEALPVMDSLSNKLSLIRILRAVMFSEAHLIELAKVDGFRTLSAVVTATNEPALTSQVMQLQRLYMEYLQSAKQAQQLRQEHLTHNITLSNISNLSQIGATHTHNAYLNAQYSKAGDALRGRAHSTSSAGSASTSVGGAYAQSNALRGGANSSAANSAQARLYTLSASTAASTANLTTTSLHNTALHAASAYHLSTHSNSQLHSMYHSTGQLHGANPSNGYFLDPNAEDTSMAAKGLNLAFNFVNELLKFAPISADWLQAQRPNKDALLLHDSLSQYYDEQLSLCNMLLSPAVLELETERVRQLEKGLDSQHLELTEHGEETAEGEGEGEVGLVLPTDFTEPNNERSLLYANNTTSSSVNTVRNTSAGHAPLVISVNANVAQSVKTQLSPTETGSAEVQQQHTSESRTSSPRNFPVLRPASRQSSRELGYLPSFPFNDPLEYIRSQMQEQDLPSVLLLAIEKAATPSEGLEALSTLQAMLVGDAAAQSCFSTSDGYSKVSAMFLRIEENLVLLVPVTDSSMAAAVGQGAGQSQRHDPNRRSTSSASTVSSYDNTSISGGINQHNNYNNNNNTSPHKHSSKENDKHKESGLYNHATKGEFDGYYSTIVMILLNILLDDIITTQISHNLPFLPLRGAEVGNYKALQLLSSLLHSGSCGLLTVGMRIIYALVKVHAPNVLVLESAGVIGTLIEILCTILYTKSIDTNALTVLFSTVHVNNGEFSARESVSDYNEIIGKAEDFSPLFSASHKSASNLNTDTHYPSTAITEHCSHQLLYTLVTDIITILQIVSVTTSNRDNSVVCLLTLLTQQCSTYYRMLNLHSAGCSTVNHVKCQNCEMETACLQCLNDGCMNDQSYLLCQECDNVFHKSTVKKSHIRIPVLPTTTAPNLSQSSSHDKLHTTFVRDSSGSIRTDSNVNSVVSGVNDTHRLPLYKHNLLDSANILRLPDPGINTNNSNGHYDSPCDTEGGTEHDMSNAVCNESFLCLLLAGIRGILDDREVRGLGLPHILFPSLLTTLRTAVSDPFKIHNRNTNGGNNVNVGNNGAAAGMDELYGCYSREMFRLPDQVRLCELVDSRADVLVLLADLHVTHSPVSASHKDKSPHSSHNAQHNNHNNNHNNNPHTSYFSTASSGADAPTPPEVTHNSSRRVRLSLLVQCVARFVISRSIVDTAPNLFSSEKDGYNELSALFKHSGGEYEHTARRSGGVSSRVAQVQTLQQLMLYGGDALLVHLLVDSSIYTQSTSLDKQYIVWLLRECLVTATCAKYEKSDRLYAWLLWLIRGNISAKGSSDATRSRQRIARRQSKTSSSSNSAVVNAKTVLPTVPPLDRTNSNLVTYTTVPSTAPLVSLPLRLMITQELRLLLHTVGEDPARHVLAQRELYEYPHFVHLNSIVYSETSSDTPGGSASSKKRTIGPQSTPTMSSSYAGALHNCLFSSFSTRKNLVTAGFVEALLDLIIGELCTPVVYNVIRDPVAGRSGGHGPNNSNASQYHDHKSLNITELEKEEWWSAFATLWALLQGCDDAKDALHAYVGIEAFVKFLLPLIEYTTVCSLDAQSSVDYRAVLNTLIVEICTKHGQFAAPAAPFACAVPRLPAQLLLHSFRVENTVPATDKRKLSKLFVRCATHKHNSFSVHHSVTQHSPRKPAPAEELSTVAALSALSPVYYLHERTAFLAGHTTQPLPLSLQNERFRRSFAIFGVSVPGPAPTTGNNNPTASVVPNKQHTNVSRNSLKASDVFDSRGRLSVDSGDIAAVGNSTHGGNASALRKLHMRRNISTASIHSAESECHWETESVGVVSSTQGDALGRASLHSLHSAHSMIALSQAIGAQSTPQTQHSRSTTPAVSVSGDLHTSSHGYATHFSAHKASDKLWDSSSHGRNTTQSFWDHHPHGGANAKLKSLGGGRNVNTAQYPFPPTIVSNNNVYPCVYVPLLAGFECGQESFSTSTLLLLHHSLLIRAGYTESVVPSDLLDTPLPEAAQSRQYSEDPIGMRMSFLSNDSTHGHMQLLPESVPDHFSIARAEGVDCSVVLRKHLSMFMLSGNNNHNQAGCHQSERELPYQPAYSRLQIRSPESCELLLAAAVVSAQQNQTFFLSTLSCMLDGNPANAHAFVIKPSTCIGLSRLMTSLREGAQEKVGYLLSQVLRYSLQQPILRELVDVVKKGRSMSIDLLEDETVSAAEDGADCKSLLFVMGRTAERVGPESFLHFDLGAPFTSRVELPSITSLPVPTIAGHTANNCVTVCSWVRLGSLGDAPTCAFLQLHSDTSDLLVDAYFRVVYKLSPKTERANTDSSGSNASTGPGHHISKRVMQLCLSFGKSTTSEGACFENGVPVPLSTANPAGPSAVQASPSKLWPDPLHAEESQIHQQSHWRLAVDQFCYPNKDIVGLDVDLPDQPHELHDAAAVLANTLCHFALPDAIVEFDWSEMGDWHLLVLGLSAEQITCSVDSIARPVLHWSPLGYQYDPHSEAIKRSTDDSIPVLKDPTMVGASNTTPVETLLTREIGHHVMDFSKALPVVVTVGGLKHEQAAYDLLRNHLTCAAGEENAHVEVGLAGLVQSFDATVSGFSGTLGEVVVMAGVVEESKVLACLRGGPISGFRELKSNRLSALTSSAVRAPRRSPSIKGVNEAEKATPALSFPSFLAPTLGVASSTPAETTPINVYSSNYALVIKEKDDLFGKARSAKDSSRDAHMVKFAEGVQIHQTTALVGAFNSIGGIKALYPLLAADKARLVAALRIIGSLISASAEASQDFRLIDADKVILYCCVQNPRLVTIETVQVLFDMTMESTHALHVSNHPASTVLNGHPAATAESIQRSVILELLLDIVVAMPRNTQLARSAIDWLREICDEHLPNCQKVLKTPGLMPVLIMLAAWELPGCENLPRGAALPSAGAIKSAKTLPSSGAASTVTESATVDGSASAIRRGRSASLGSAPEKHFDPLRSSQVIDISKAAAAKVTDNSKLGLSSGSADERVLGRGATVRAHNDSKLRLMDRVNMEYLQKTLADEQDAAATHAFYAERYKLQLSCSRLIRLLISGTSGEVAHASGNVMLNLNNTSTEFSAQHLAMLLSFAVVAGSTKHVTTTTTDDSAASVSDINNSYSRNREQRHRAARVKRLIYGTFSGIPMLRHVDIAAPTYWINSAGLVALDSIIDAINSALHVQIVSLLKNSFSAANLHSMMLQLMGSECAEIRERSLRILLFSFSSLDGKLDARQVSSFDRMHGFQCLAAQLSAHPDGCTDAILQGLLSLVFWRRNKRRASSSNGSNSSDLGERRFSIDSHHGEDDEGFFPIKTVSPENTRPSSLDLRHHQHQSSSAEHTPRGSVTAAAALSPVPENAELPATANTPAPVLTLSTAQVQSIPTASAPAVSAPVAAAPRSPTAGATVGYDSTSAVATATASAGPASVATSTSTANAGTAQPSGSLLSLFSWGGSAPAKPTAGPTSSASIPAPGAAATAITPVVTPAAVTVNQATGKVDVPVVDASRSNELARKDSSTGSDSHTVNTDEERSANPERNSDISAPSANKPLTADDARTAVNHKIYLVDVIEVPQALEALFAVLENSRSAEQVTGTLKVLEQSVSVTAVASSMHQELSLATNVLHLRNAENFFAQKDWLMWLCDLLVLFARQAMHVEDQEGSASVFSLSESESLTGTGTGAGQGYYGGGCYDTSGEDSESNSVAGDYFSEDPSPHFNPGHRHAKGGSVGSGESRDGRVTTWQQQLIDQYCAPIYNLIRKLILQDMTAHKPSSARRWNELFRLSLPELNSIQERLLTDLVVSMRNLSEFCEDVNATLNLLKNLSALLEQALEKVDLSLVFCVKVVQALHTLTYTCAPEVRSRIKETALPEMRKQFVVRCLLDNSQDYYNKVAAISEISSPLMGYVSSTEAKPLADTNVVMIVLGMLVEACEDLEFLLGGVDSSDVVLNESAGSLRGQNSSTNHNHANHNQNDDYRLVGSPIPTNTYDRVHLLFEVLEVLIECVQNCVLSSAECRKCVSKLVQNIPGDPARFCLAAFTKNFNQQMSSAKSSRSSSLIVGAGANPAGQGDAASENTSAIIGAAGETENRVKNSTTGSTGSGVTSNAGAGAASAGGSTPSQQQQQQQQSYSWWSGWSTTDSATDPNTSNNNNSTNATNNVGDNKIDAPRNNSDRDLEANRSGKHSSGRLTASDVSHLSGTSAAENVEEEVQGPANIRAFISWFCSFDQRELQGEFRVRVLNEIRPTQRATDKLREKTAQRYMRHSRQAQEKRTKEKAYISRTAKDALTTVKSVTDKVSTKFQKDTKSWVAGINDKFEGGKTVFNNSFEDRLAGAKSPLKDLKASNQPLYTHHVSSPAAHLSSTVAGAQNTNSVHSSTQPGVFSERLKRFLSADHNNMEGPHSSPAAFTTENVSRSASLVGEYDASSALNDLLAYFQQNVSANCVN